MQAPTAEVQAVLEVHSEVDEGEGICISFTLIGLEINMLQLI